MSEQELAFWNRVLELAQGKFTQRTVEIFIQAADFVGIKDDKAYIRLTDVQRDLWLLLEEKILTIILTAGFEIYQKEITTHYLSATDDNEEFIDQTVEPIISEPLFEPVNSHLNQRYTFDNFIQGEGNRWPLAAALAVADSPGTVYNPLFIWGGPGLGKTHLLNAIGNEVLVNNPNARINYLTTEDFVNEFVQYTLKKKDMEELKERFRTLDVLLIDDIQFLTNKEKTQDEFFNTFNALYKENKQIVITSDRAPEQLNNLEKRLVSRFGWGLTQQITPPDYETRVAILLDKTQNSPYDFQEEAIEYLANQFDSNVRELEGALQNINLIATSRGITTISIDIVAEALRSIKPTNTTISVIPIEKIQDEVASFFGISVKDIKGTKRVQSITLARQVAMYLTREMTDYSLPKIGKEFGGRDHTTVLHSYNKIKGLLEKDKNLRVDIDAIKTKLR